MPEAIFEDGPVDTPYVYTVSGTGTVTPRACAAVYNGSGAGGDFIPAVIFRSLAGNVIARATLDSTIVAGDDAEVSWFPGVKHAGGATASPVAWLSVGLDTDAGDTAFTVDTNTVTAVEFSHAGSNVGSAQMQPRPAPDGNFNGILLRSTDYLYFIQSSLLWQFNGFPQYALIDGPPPDYSFGGIAGAVSNHGEQPAATTNGAFVFVGDGLWSVDYKTYQPSTVPATITLDAFQLSNTSQDVVKANMTVIAYKVF